MKKQKRYRWASWVVLLLVFWWLWVETGSAATYYVKPLGSDGAGGTSWGTAWATIDKVNATITGGDTVFFGPGSWFNSTIKAPTTGGSSSDSTFFISGDGVTNNPSKYASFIYGGDSLTGWVAAPEVGTNVYKCRYTAPKYNYYDSYLDEVYACYQHWGTGLYNDSPLVKWTTGTAALTSPGRYYYSPSLDTIWVYLRDLGGLGYNPANYGVFPCQNRCFQSKDGAKYVVVRGFVFKYGNHMPVYFGYGDHGDHTRITNCLVWASGTNRTAGDNTNAIGSLGILDQYDAGRGQCNQVDSNRIGVIWEIGGQNGGSETWLQMAGIGLYSESAFVSIFNDIGPRVGYGIWYKGDGSPQAVPGGAGGTNKCGASFIGFNTIHDVKYHGICHYYPQPYDSIIGNTIYNSGRNGIEMQYYETYGANCGPQFCQNNTIFNSYDRGMIYGNGGGNTFPLYPGTTKYNIISQSLGLAGEPYTVVMQCRIANMAFNLDSNIFWAGNGGRTTFRVEQYGGALGCPSPNGTPRSGDLSWWQTYSAAVPKQAFDIHSTSANPSFTDTTTHDFSRLASSVEIPSYTIRGVTMTRIGSWQPAGATPSSTSKRVRGVKRP